MSIKGTTSAEIFHKRLGKILWEYCGMARNEEGLKKALKIIPELREEFIKICLFWVLRKNLIKCLKRHSESLTS